MPNCIILSDYILSLSDMNITDDVRNKLLNEYNDNKNGLFDFFNNAIFNLFFNNYMDNTMKDYIINEYINLGLESLCTKDVYDDLLNLIINKSNTDTRMDKIKLIFNTMNKDGISELFKFSLYYFLLKIMINNMSILDSKDLALTLTNYLQDNMYLYENIIHSMYNLIRIIF